MKDIKLNRRFLEACTNLYMGEGLEYNEASNKAMALLTDLKKYLCEIKEEDEQ